MRHNQNRRSRGRSRKGPNPLTRSYESNGPDVKVRGTAAHVAEKYMTLARDAQSSGDTVSAENYLQHAEHYNRIVMAAQAQFQQTQPQFREGSDEGYDDDRQMNGRFRDRFDYNGDGRNDDEGYEGGSDERGYRDRRFDDQQQRGPRPDRQEARDRPDRDRPDRDRLDRDRPDRDRPDRDRPRESVDPTAEPQPEVPAPAEAASPAEEASAPPLPRRRRGRPKKQSAGEGEVAEAQDSDEDSTKDGAAALAAFPE
jgi:hypothetical protein